MNCQNCKTTTEGGYPLCETCELRFAGTLLRLARDVTPLHDSLDATLHPGGHSPVRIRTATPPTPIRLDVLDLLDLLDATARELWRCLDGIDALDWRRDPRMEDLKATLIACAGHPRLPAFADAGLYMRIVDDLARKVDLALDPPEQRMEIGTCELCGTMLTAGTADQWVTCPVCGREQRAQTVRLRRLRTLCWDDSRRGSAADVARAFAEAGIKVSRKTVATWGRRGRLPRHADGYAYCDVYRLLVGPDLTEPIG